MNNNNYLDEEELQRIQEQADANNESVGYVDSFNKIGQALAGSNQQLDVNAYKAQNAQMVKDYILKKQAARQSVEQEQKDKAFAQEQTDNNTFRDPNSKLAVAAKKAMKQLGYDVDPNTSLYDLKRQGIDPFKMIEERRALNATLGAKAKAENSNRDLDVPGVGEAMTKDDAKIIKDASQMKTKLDGQIQEMINLRKKHNGGAVWASEDISRGKQLSKDLLLTYKNMAKLGVLSKSDEDIVNAIIPADPLEYKVSGVWGQDPIIHTLEKFKEDNNRDYEEQLDKRLYKRYAPTPAEQQKAEVKAKEEGGFFDQYKRKEPTTDVKTAGFRDKG